MQQRQVLQSSVDTWQHTLERLEPQVLSIIYEEREERALRKAEMEATKVCAVLAVCAVHAELSTSCVAAEREPAS